MRSCTRWPSLRSGCSPCCAARTDGSTPSARREAVRDLLLPSGGPPAMKRSTERILTTHVGSLSRPDALVPILTAKDRGQPYDRDAYARLVREAVADVVRRQTDAAVDVITDGEQSKASFF